MKKNPWNINSQKKNLQNTNSQDDSSGTCGMSCVNGCKPGGLPISGQRNRGQNENIAAVREQDGAGQTNQDNHAAKRRKRQGHRDNPGAGSRTGIIGYGSRTGEGRGGAGEDGLMTADQWQMVPGYGICKRGEPVLYVLDMDASQMKTDEKESAPGFFLRCFRTM